MIKFSVGWYVGAGLIVQWKAKILDLLSKREHDPTLTTQNEPKMSVKVRNIGAS